MQYQTVSALLTATAQHTSRPESPSQNPTAKPSLSQEKMVTPSPEQTEGVLMVISVTQTAGNGNEKTSGTRCNLAHPGRPIDITIPDDTRVYPGEYFSKTWRLVNGGSCTWDQNYSVVWFSGDDLGVNHAQRFNAEIMPGASVDVTVDMIAPETPGTYQSNWKLRNTQGELFGIGPNGDAPFWVRIVVVPLETATVTPTQSLPTSTSTPSISAEGSLLLEQEDGVDLDSGLLNQEEKNDLRLQFSEDKSLVLVPVGDARVTPFGAGRPDFTDCKLAPLSPDPLHLNQYQPGMYFCYRTTQGLPGWFLLSSLDLAKEEAGMEFLTWAAP